MSVIVVKAAWDEEAGVWWTESSDLFGLNASGETLEALVAELPAVAADLLEERGEPSDDVLIEVIAHASTRVRALEAA